ncbi:type II toxin-antitoxin system RelE/ParE family toxin [Rhizobium sophoriradicis]|uniref:type II toxin-antitoxin system RelE/ParE family toxin n=1 Tax=Rhizobium sophoriradicis TaxID=1535245 RepID=UPI00098F0E83|nr:type II toxin-antitoxin system RelE/ParE family toxin [Rhizobium sophoriradicis]RSC21037.1 type II toxin-antitoxin system RelE/ParE family toxin [Rhizobium sophoriradicis]
MRAYRFYPRAEAAQDKIWRDTFEAWGQKQADAYILGLHAYLQRLRGSTGDNFHNVWREFENGDLGIISILYERMNLSLRLKEDLAALSRKQP